MSEKSKSGATHSTANFYVAYGALVLLTIATVALSFCHLDEWHTVIGLFIAYCKSGLVLLVFMHFLGSAHVSRLALFAGLLWLAILISLNLADYLSRTWLIY